MSAVMLLDGFPAGTTVEEVLDFILSRCNPVEGYVTSVILRVDAQGRETGIAEVHFGQRAWINFVLFIHEQHFRGHEIVVLPLEQHDANVAVSPPPRPLQALALAMGVPPPSVAAALVPDHRTVVAEEHCALRYDVAGSTIVQHQLIQQPNWWPYNNPRILLQLPTIPQLRRSEPDGWNSWDEMLADVVYRSRLLEEAHAELNFRLRQVEIDTATLQANGVDFSLPLASTSTSSGV